MSKVAYLKEVEMRRNHATDLKKTFGDGEMKRCNKSTANIVPSSDIQTWQLIQASAQLHPGPGSKRAQFLQLSIYQGQYTIVIASAFWRSTKTLFSHSKSDSLRSHWLCTELSSNNVLISLFPNVVYLDTDKFELM